jgi:hypothetical protein
MHRKVRSATIEPKRLVKATLPVIAEAPDGSVFILGRARSLGTPERTRRCASARGSHSVLFLGFRLFLGFFLSLRYAGQGGAGTVQLFELLPDSA